MTGSVRWWDMRPAKGGQAKTYTCPICHRLLLAMNPNTLLYPEGDARTSPSCSYRLRRDAAEKRQPVDQSGVGTVSAAATICRAIVVAQTVRLAPGGLEQC